MAAVGETVAIPASKDSTAATILRWVARTPVNLVLAALGLLWLVPTLGLFITSILPASSLASQGWWQIFCARAGQHRDEPRPD